MLWIEMSRDATHGGGTWDFSKCLWSPVHKKKNDGGIGSKWPYWENVLKVEAGDSILHLRGKDEDAAFVGFSTAAADGFKTSERPLNPRRWGYDYEFYKVPLKDFRPLKQNIKLSSVFDKNDAALRDYFNKNRFEQENQKKKLFYVIQAGRLQCQNGAYLTEADDILAKMILGSDYLESTSSQATLPQKTDSGERLQELRIRVGQKDFSDNVKKNYNYYCCFPNCSINDSKFLIGAHIARWADAPDLRGELSNGLCLCVLHDRAFELGYFTLDENFKVASNNHNTAIMESDIFKTYIEPHKGKTIKLGVFKPSLESLKQHWERLGFPKMI